MKNWWIAIRPKTLWVSVSPILIGVCLAYSDFASIQLLLAVITTIAAVLIQIGTNLANDYFDYIKGADTQDRLGPVRVTQAGLISPKQIYFAFVSAFVLSALTSLYLLWYGGWPILLIGVLSILFGILYTGSKFSLAYLGVADLFALVFFGPVAVGGTYYLQTSTITPLVIISGLAPGFLAMAILTVNNLRDRETDSKVNKKTLAVRFGDTFARCEYLICVIATLLTPVVIVYLDRRYRYTLIACLLVFLFIPLIRTVFTATDRKKLNPVLAKTSQMLILYALLFSFGCWFSKII